jgi:hypothetical protein
MCNFHDYWALRIDQMPLDIMRPVSSEDPGGVGEWAVPCVVHDVNRPQRGTQEHVHAI